MWTPAVLSVLGDDVPRRNLKNQLLCQAPQDQTTIGTPAPVTMTAVTVAPTVTLTRTPTLTRMMRYHQTVMMMVTRTVPEETLRGWTRDGNGRPKTPTVAARFSERANKQLGIAERGIGNTGRYQTPCGQTLLRLFAVQGKRS